MAWNSRTDSTSPRIGNSATAKTIHHIWFIRGKLLARQGYYEAALASFKAALRIEPGHLQSWIFQGAVLAHLGRYPAALASFEQATNLAPENREAWIFRGAILASLGRGAESIQCYRQALQMQQQEAVICQDYPLWMPTDMLSGLMNLAG
jgi:Flp pilus assembly protein TadD